MMQLLSKLENKAQGLVNSAFVSCSCNKGPKRLKTSVWLSMIVLAVVLVLALYLVAYNPYGLTKAV